MVPNTVSPIYYSIVKFWDTTIKKEPGTRENVEQFGKKGAEYFNKNTQEIIASTVGGDFNSGEVKNEIQPFCHLSFPLLSVEENSQKYNAYIAYATKRKDDPTTGVGVNGWMHTIGNYKLDFDKLKKTSNEIANIISKNYFKFLKDDNNNDFGTEIIRPDIPDYTLRAYVVGSNIREYPPCKKEKEELDSRLKQLIEISDQNINNIKDFKWRIQQVYYKNKRPKIGIFAFKGDGNNGEIIGVGPKIAFEEFMNDILQGFC